MDADEIQRIIRTNIDNTVSVVYADGNAEEPFVHTVDDEGFVCDLATGLREPPNGILGTVQRCG